MSLLHPHLPPTRPTPPQARQPPALAGECRGRRAPTGPAALRVRACQPQPPQQPPQRRRGARRVSAPALDAPALVAPGANRCEARVCQASWPCVGASRGALLSSCTVQVTVVMKFGGSSVADAARMREVAAIVCGFTDELPCVVLSAMGKVRRRCRGPRRCQTRQPGGPAHSASVTRLPPCAPARHTPDGDTRARAAQTTNLLLQAGAEAVKGRPAGVPSLAPLRAVKELHRQAADELGVGEDAHAEVEALLGELQQLLIGIAIMQARPPRCCRTHDNCVLACTCTSMDAPRLYEAEVLLGGLPQLPTGIVFTLAQSLLHFAA
jgi:hypothetical protein